MPLARSVRGYKQHAAELMRYIDRLGEFVKQVGQCHVVLTSLIPSPDHNYKCKWAFKHFSKLLKDHALANRDVFTFCDVKPIFMKNHKIDYEFSNLSSSGNKDSAISVKIGMFLLLLL